jgi:hypothetical protein
MRPANYSSGACVRVHSACSLVSLLCGFHAFSGGPGQAPRMADERSYAAISYPVAYRGAVILSAILLSHMVYRI